MDRAVTAPADKVESTPVPWRHSLRTRLLAWSSLTNVLVLAGTMLAVYAGIREVLVANAAAETRNLALQTARSVQAAMDSVQDSGRVLAASTAGVGREPFNLRSLLQAALVGDEDIAGAMLIIEPGAYKADEAGFTWYVRRDEHGLHEESVESLGYDYHVMPWYVRTKAATHPWWSEPYANAATRNQWFTTYNLPLHRPGDPPGAPAIGMVSVDVPIDRLKAMIEALPDDSGLRPMLFSPEGLVVLHPDVTVQMHLDLDGFINRDGRTDLVPLREHLKSAGEFQFRHVVPKSGEVRYTLVLPVADTGWHFAMSANEDYILRDLNRITLYAALFGLLGILLSQLVIRRFTRLIAEPIEDLTDSARHFAGGEFDYPLGHVERNDEVGVMARAFDSARASIKQQMSEIADLGAARQKLESELSIARDIQLAMLPASRVFDGLGTELDTSALLEPAKAVGGDFYTFFERDGNSLWFVVGDVSDKGIPAALFMARSVTVLEVAARLGGSPQVALLEAARHLTEGNETCMFATVLCGVIEEETGMCALASAGHESPVLLHGDGRAELLPVQPGPPLGFEIAERYHVWRGRMRPGDTLVIYTDGITEAFNAADQPFGSDRLLAGLDPALSATEQCRALLRRVHAFVGDAAQSDDITVLAIKFMSGNSGEED